MDIDPYGSPDLRAPGCHPRQRCFSQAPALQEPGLGDLTDLTDLGKDLTEFGTDLFSGKIMRDVMRYHFSDGKFCQMEISREVQQEP